MTPPALSRLADEQPPQWVEEPSVSGRSTPRPGPLPDGFRHDVRFNGAIGGNGISAYCQPCHWGIWIDDGHDLTDLIRLCAMHAGVTDITVTTTEALLDLLKPLVSTP
jgi:hypothetical protein